jgi:hypothetical protein
MASAPWRDQIAAAEWITARLPLAARTGSDSADRDDIPLVSLWTEILGRGDAAAVAEWSAAGGSYWAAAPATVDGVLGGFSALHPGDAAHSLRLVARLTSELGVGQRAALDVGAGVGRVCHVSRQAGPREVQRQVQPTTRGRGAAGGGGGGGGGRGRGGGRSNPPIGPPPPPPPPPPRPVLD